MTLRSRVTAPLRHAIPPSLRSELDWFLQAARESARKANVLSWTRAPVQPPGCSHPVVYIGTKENRLAAELHLSGRHSNGPRHAEVVVISDLPLPGSLRLPRYLQPTVPLARSLEDIMEGYGDKLRRVVRQQMARVRLVQARDAELIELADQQLLRPYAQARYGPGAAQLDSHLVRQIAMRDDGRLDMLYVSDEPVACHLGLTRIRRGKRYWNAIRFGFAESVYSHPKRLHEINSVNVHLAIQWAKVQGFDFYNLGDCLARPDDGLLHWKRRRGGQLSAGLCQEWFYVRLPHRGRAQFLWETPLFSAGWRGRRLCLHLGIPADKDDVEALARFREMSFSGLERVVIHHARHLSENLLEGLRALYADIKPAPRFETRQAG